MEEMSYNLKPGDGGEALSSTEIDIVAFAPTHAIRI
jgi:hypothetical protein